MKTLNWPEILRQLNGHGYAHIPGVWSADECRELYSQYNSSELYRSTINMERYRFGKGEYKYFKYPLPPLPAVLSAEALAQVEALAEAGIARMRTDFYAPLARLANEWMLALGAETKYPEAHEEFLKTCHAAGQLRPTPLILKYETGGYNTLHQDLYGEVYFPFQVVLLLTEPCRDHTGGELVFVEQFARAQSRATVVTPRQGDAVIFTTNFRPVKGSRGWYRARMKHGISTVTSGTRYACGIIFHDAA